jgi:hypothetical protein
LQHVGVDLDEELDELLFPDVCAHIDEDIPQMKIEYYRYCPKERKNEERENLKCEAFENVG